MSRGKYQSKEKSLPVLLLVVALLLIAAMSTGGIVAYLATAPEKGVTNTFVLASPPKPQVVANQDGNYCVDVGDPGYEVYVRAAVVANWKYGNEIIPAPPSAFSFTPGEGWVLHDGFFYYTKPIASGSTSAIYTAVTASANPGGVLHVDIAVQAIQAPGGTDETDTMAVINAWGVDPKGLAPNN